MARNHFSQAVIVFVSSALIVFGGVALSPTFVRSLRIQAPAGFVSALLGLDGRWYRDILENGYSSVPGGWPSNAAFFPVYPLTGRLVAQITGLDSELVLVGLSNAFLLCALAVMSTYVARRSDNTSPAFGGYVLFLVALFPTTLFFRAAYSEATFLLLSALFLHGLQRGWPLSPLALVVALATATRPVGIALVPVFGLAAWHRLDGRAPKLGIAAHVGVIGALVTVASSGLLAFIVFQWWNLGDPLSFVSGHTSWVFRTETHASITRKLVSVASLEPIWAVYAPWKPEYWRNYEPHGNPLLSLHFANPIYFVGTIALVILGWQKKWLNEYELLLSAGLLAIPYVTKSYDNAMASFGRFSAVVLPAYIVMGHLLHRMGPAWAALVLALMAVMLFIYSAMFAAGYRMI
jgi:hypothetical protein